MKKNQLKSISLIDTKVAAMVLEQLCLDEALVADSIDDFMDENQLDLISNSTTDIGDCLQCIEELRSNYRRRHKEIKLNIPNQYDDTYGKLFTEKMQSMKNYIKMLKSQLKYLKDKSSLAVECETEAKERKVTFLVSEVDQSITTLIDEFDVTLSDKTDEEIKRRKNEIPEKLKLTQDVSSMLKEIMECPNPNKAGDIELLCKRYEKLVLIKNVYTSNVNEEMKIREVDKKKEFNASLLNIKLSKYKGYESKHDIYTFQSEFEKLYLKSTPVSLLPDLLKNNFLEDPALLLVKNVDNMEEIWKRLKDAFGDTKTMLSKKLSELKNIEGTWKLKDPSKVAEALTRIINIMKDLMKLASKHKIEGRLYHSDALDKIYNLLGDNRVTRWLSSSYDSTKEDHELWDQLIGFLEKEIKIHQQKAMIHGKNVQQKANPERINDGKNNHGSRHHLSHDNTNNKVQNICFICGEANHVTTGGPYGQKLVQYFACKNFVDMSPAQRFETLTSKGYCFQCLYPGAVMRQGRHREGHCQKNFVCQHSSHDRFTAKKHFLVCDEHKDSKENLDMLSLYKSRFISRHSDLPAYTKDLKLSHHASYKSYDDTDQSAIYMLQTVSIDNKNYSIFFDTGCSSFISRHDAIQKLGSRAKQLCPGPIKLGGVGNSTIETPHGIYNVNIPLTNGTCASMTGLCMEKITAQFPMYPLDGKVASDIKRAYKASGGDIKNLPNLPKTVGGETDFMIGIKYLKFYPKQIFQLPSGLTIYQSPFQNSDGSYGVIGGPHSVFTEIEKYHLSSTSFAQDQYHLFQHGYQVSIDAPLLCYKNDDITDITYSKYDINQFVTTNHSTKQIKRFYGAEEVGSEITFRCIKCRECKECKEHDGELISIKEEMEQHLINKSVVVNTDDQITTASLPLLHDPLVKLCPNKDKAMKVYNQQLKKLKNNPTDREAVIKSEGKLQSLGHVEYVKNLPQDIQDQLSANPVKNFIPWRIMWKESSTTTPCRLVFDASQPTDTGYSLNDILAKGRNNMNKLLEVFLRWRIHTIAYHTDIQKMYNAVQLNQKDWCLQRYLWSDTLDPSKQPEEKIIKTLIYGVKSSGNQAERGIRQTAMKFKDLYPKVFEVITKDIYVDDCLSGCNTLEEATHVTNNLEAVLNQGGFTLKGITISGNDPIEKLSTDGVMVSVAGLNWYPKDDFIALDIKDLNFAKRVRGRKQKMISDVPEKLTKRICTSKVAEVFDISGMMTPITATLKLDLHDLSSRKLEWDDLLPENLRELWCNNFNTIMKLKDLHYQRAIVPQDAATLDVTTLEFGDASQSLVCIAIYVRFKRKCGNYSSQLLFARSRIVPDEMSQPRGELYAAVVNTHSSEVVQKALKKYHKGSTKFTDSQIAFYWIMNDRRTLKTWVRNRVIEIRRCSDIATWRYVRSADMIADIGTRRCSSIEEIKPESLWFTGYPWMKGDEKDFPVKTIEEVTLTNSEIQQMKKERHHELDESLFYSDKSSKLPDQVAEYYKFSGYVIDPNRHSWYKIVRILSIAILFFRKLRDRVKQKRKISEVIKFDEIKNQMKIIIPDEVKREAEKYFYRKATLEVKKFLKPSQYQNLSKEVDGILHYTGRILPCDEITVVGKATSVMKDLSSTMFCVPLVSSHSPIAYSIIHQIHWENDASKHSGVETTLRHVLKIVYVVEGRQLIKKIKSTCERCRYLEKKLIEVIMGPVSRHNLTIAPPFYITQLDLAGPYLSYSNHHKRTTVKVWLIVFCCSTTSAVKIKIMDDYSTSAFIMAFQRFACDVGFPKLLLPDEGSQLVKGCDSIVLDFIDLQYQLHKDVGVEFKTCPVGGHNMHGKVERKIQEIKSSLQKSFSGQRLSILQYETICASIANNINNMPLAIRNIKSTFEGIDIITPNRLLLGRNNERSPIGSLEITYNHEKLINANQKVFDSWFEIWLVSHVPQLMDHPKWFRSDIDVQVGDVILFIKQESPLSNSYQFGMIDEVEYGRDDKIRKVKVRYRNSNENVDRFTYRNVRKLVIIHRINEINIMNELFNASRKSDIIYSKNTSSGQTFHGGGV